MWWARVAAWGYRVVLLLMRGWWLVARPRSSGVRCVLRHRDMVLLVRHSYGDRRWMLPGGRMRRGEPPVVTARREMRQELGVDCSAWTVIGCLRARERYRRQSRQDAFRRHSTYYLRAELSTDDITPRAVEITQARWFPLGALPEDRLDALDELTRVGWLGIR